MTDLGDLLGVDLQTPRPPQRRRCRHCHRRAAVSNMVGGYGEKCATRHGLIVHRWRLTRPAQTGPTLFDNPGGPVLTTDQREALQYALLTLAIDDTPKGVTAYRTITALLAADHPTPAVFPTPTRELAEPDIATNATYPDAR